MACDGWAGTCSGLQQPSARAEYGEVRRRRVEKMRGVAWREGGREGAAGATTICRRSQTSENLRMGWEQTSSSLQGLPRRRKGRQVGGVEEEVELVPCTPCTSSFASMLLVGGRGEAREGGKRKSELLEGDEEDCQERKGGVGARGR
eukprot:733178-Hanusia_phi.AAC.1